MQPTPEENNAPANAMTPEQINSLFIEKILKQIKYSPEDSAPGRKPKSVVLLSSEYMPKSVSNISIHCKSLADGLVDKGIRVNVITPDPWKKGQVIEMGGVKVYYIDNSIRTYSPLTWALTLNMEIGHAMSKIIHEETDIDLIHAHQWEMFPAGLMLQAALRKPLVVNYYSIQSQRTPFMSNAYIEAVKQLEFKASNDSDKIHVVNDWLKNEILKWYSPQFEKINVVDPNRKQWTRDVVRDYKWIMQNFGRNNGH